MLHLAGTALFLLVTGALLQQALLGVVDLGEGRGRRHGHNIHFPASLSPQSTHHLTPSTLSTSLPSPVSHHMGPPTSGTRLFSSVRSSQTVQRCSTSTSGSLNSSPTPSSTRFSGVVVTSPSHHVTSHDPTPSSMPISSRSHMVSHDPTLISSTRGHMMSHDPSPVSSTRSHMMSRDLTSPSLTSTGDHMISHDLISPSASLRISTSRRNLMMSRDQQTLSSSSGGNNIAPTPSASESAHMTSHDSSSPSSIDSVSRTITHTDHVISSRRHVMSHDPASASSMSPTRNQDDMSAYIAPTSTRHMTSSHESLATTLTHTAEVGGAPLLSRTPSLIPSSLEIVLGSVHATSSRQVLPPGGFLSRILMVTPSLPLSSYHMITVHPRPLTSPPPPSSLDSRHVRSMSTLVKSMSAHVNSMSGHVRSMSWSMSLASSGTGVNSPHLLSTSPVSSPGNIPPESVTDTAHSLGQRSNSAPSLATPTPVGPTGAGGKGGANYLLVLYVVPPVVGVLLCVLCVTTLLCCRKYRRIYRFRQQLVPLTDMDGSEDSDDSGDAEPTFMVNSSLSSRPILAFDED